MRRTIIIIIMAVAAILALVVATLVVVLTQRPVSYRTDDSAEAVAYNYTLAILQQDFAMAYAQLSPTLPGYPPTLEDFVLVVTRYGSGQPAGTGISLTTRSISETRAIITVRLNTLQPGGLFGNSIATDMSNLELTRIDGRWRITGGSLLPYCFTREEGCP